MIEKLLKSVKFEGFNPMTLGADILIQPDKPFDLDWKRTRIAEEFSTLERNVDELCFIPRMSTKAIAVIINGLVRDMHEDLAYVNVGVWNGFSFLAGMLGNPGKMCVGVDNFSEFGGPKEAFLSRFFKARSDKHIFSDMDYKLFLEKCCSVKMGVYFYDGEHSRENQREGLLRAESFFVEGCYVIVDDLNMPAVQEGTEDFLRLCSYRYKEIFRVNTASNFHPTFWNGLLILQRL